MMNYMEVTNGKARIPVPNNAERLMEVITAIDNIPVGENEFTTCEGIERYQYKQQIRSALSAAFYGKSPDTKLDPAITELAADLLHEYNLLPRGSTAYFLRRFGFRSKRNAQDAINKLLGLDATQSKETKMA